MLLTMSLVPRRHRFCSLRVLSKGRVPDSDLEIIQVPTVSASRQPCKVRNAKASAKVKVLSMCLQVNVLARSNSILVHGKG
jgi:hypothetical protein